jgi:integrase
MESGKVRNRSGEPYKPSAVRGYRRALRLRVLPELGHRPLADIRRRDVQAFVEDMQDAGLTPSTIRNTLDPLRVIFRRAIRDEQLDVDPMLHLELPADRGRRDRFAMPDEAAALIAALPDSERGLWATAFYTGLRRGELRELRCSDYNRKSGSLRVERALDDAGSVILTKTYAGGSRRAGDSDAQAVPGRAFTSQRAQR